MTVFSSISTEIKSTINAGVYVPNKREVIKSVLLRKWQETWQGKNSAKRENRNQINVKDGPRLELTMPLRGLVG